MRIAKFEFLKNIESELIDLYHQGVHIGSLAHEEFEKLEKLIVGFVKHKVLTGVAVTDTPPVTRIAPQHPDAPSEMPAPDAMPLGVMNMGVNFGSDEVAVNPVVAEPLPESEGNFGGAGASGSFDTGSDSSSSASDGGSASAGSSD